MAASNDRIIIACESEWDTWKADCSGFVKAVARQVGVELRGKANQIIDDLEGASTWSNLGADPKTAITRANNGAFVIGGLKDSPNGHVVVVVKSGGSRYPVAYWGRLGMVGRKNTTINWSWNSSDLPGVHFFAKTL